MNNELQKHTPSIISEKLLSSLSEKQLKGLSEHYTKEMINLHIYDQKKEINRSDISDTIEKLTNQTRDAMSHGAEIKISTTITHDNSETKVELSDPASANRESKLHLYIFALIALIIIVFLFK
jgi:hypothetical protein